jgi:hypothetical protein
VTALGARSFQGATDGFCFLASHSLSNTGAAAMQAARTAMQFDVANAMISAADFRAFLSQTNGELCLKLSHG